MAVLVHGVVQKFTREPDRLITLIYTDPRGVQIVVDEQVFQKLPNGQDLVVRFMSTTQTTADSGCLSPTPYSSLAVRPSSPRSQIQKSHNLPLAETGSLDRPPGTGINLDYLVTDAALMAQYINPSESDSDQIWTADSVGTSSFSPPTSAYATSDNQWTDLRDSSDRTVTDWSSLQLFSQPSEMADDIPMGVDDWPPTEAATVSTNAPDTVDSGAIHVDTPEPTTSLKKPKRPYKPFQHADDSRRKVALEKNRKAAATCRSRKKIKEGEQRDDLRDKVQENNMLRSTLLDLQTQMNTLTEMLAEHDNVCGLHAE